MAQNPGGYHQPEKTGFVIALVKAIRNNQRELGTAQPKPKKGSK